MALGSARAGGVPKAPLRAASSAASRAAAAAVAAADVPPSGEPKLVGFLPALYWLSTSSSCDTRRCEARRSWARSCMNWRSLRAYDSLMDAATCCSTDGASKPAPRPPGPPRTGAGTPNWDSAGCAGGREDPELRADWLNPPVRGVRADGIVRQRGLPRHTRRYRQTCSRAPSRTPHGTVMTLGRVARGDACVE